MRYATSENDIGFHLIKVKGAAAKSGAEAYRAVMEHDSLSPEETLAELQKETGIPAAQLQYIGSSIMNALYAGTVRDGRSRNFENFLSTRLDIVGKFDRIDAPFDQTKHHCVLGLVPGAKTNNHIRHKLPVNETKPPRGRFDYVTYPGGEKGFIKFGEPIEIHGHDLLLDKNKNMISMLVFDAKGKNHRYSTILEGRGKLDPYDSELLYNSNDFILAAWPQSWSSEDVIGCTIRFHFLDSSGKESHDSYSRMATILR